MRWDWWEVFGIVGNMFFFVRLFVQWAATEEARKPVLPITYWYLSLAGCFIMILYSLHIGNAIVLTPYALGMIAYARNLQLEIQHRRSKKTIETIN